MDELNVDRNNGYVLVLETLSTGEPGENVNGSPKELFRLVNSKLTMAEVTKLISETLEANSP